MDRASVGEIFARSNAARSSGRERWPWLRPRWISSSTWVMVASSSCPGDVAVAVLGLRHPPFVLLVPGLRCSPAQGRRLGVAGTPHTLYFAAPALSTHPPPAP